MDEKKNLFRLFKCLGLSIGIAVICFGCFVLVVDPFYQYHAPWLNIPVVLEDAVYQTAGAARNLEYDSAIVGTSMTENFHTSWFDEEMGWNTMKLSYSGARSNDLNAILEQISCREECLNHVVLDINEYQLTSEKWIQYVDRPEYLYDSKWINDYKYLFFTGWNTIDKDTADKLVTYVKKGGKKPPLEKKLFINYINYYIMLKISAYIMNLADSS